MGSAMLVKDRGYHLCARHVGTLPGDEWQFDRQIHTAPIAFVISLSIWEGGFVPSVKPKVLDRPELSTLANGETAPKTATRDAMAFLFNSFTKALAIPRSGAPSPRRRTS